MNTRHSSYVFEWKFGVLSQCGTLYFLITCIVILFFNLFSRYFHKFVTCLYTYKKYDKLMCNHGNAALSPRNIAKLTKRYINWWYKVHKCKLSEWFSQSLEKWTDWMCAWSHHCPLSQGQSSNSLTAEPWTEFHLEVLLRDMPADPKLPRPMFLFFYFNYPRGKDELQLEAHLHLSEERTARLHHSPVTTPQRLIVYKISFIPLDLWFRGWQKKNEKKKHDPR